MGHEADEFESLRDPQARPSQYDIAFLWRIDERMVWSLEAKVLRTEERPVSANVKDVREQLLTGWYAPFSNEGAMLGFLIKAKGEPAEALRYIAASLGAILSPFPFLKTRHWISVYEWGTSIPNHQAGEFRCDHLIMAVYSPAAQ